MRELSSALRSCCSLSKGEGFIDVMQAARRKKRHKVPHSYLLGVSGVEHYVKLASVSKVKLCWRFAYTRAA